MILPYLFAAALALVTQTNTTVSFGTTETPLLGPETAIIPIPLPTDKYKCVRLPVSRRDDTLSVFVGCAIDDKPAFMLAALCRTDVPDSDIAVLMLNVAKEGPPRPVKIEVQCATGRGPEVL